MINLLVFILIISLLNKIGVFLIVSVILNLLAPVYNYGFIILGFILLGFFGWCFGDN